MNFAIALVLTTSGPGLALEASDAAMRDAILRQSHAQARASVTILQPEMIDFRNLKARGERAKIRRDAFGTIWLEFS